MDRKSSMIKVINLLVVIVFVLPLLFGCTPTAPAAETKAAATLAPTTEAATKAPGATEAPAATESTDNVKRGGTLLWGAGSLAIELDLRFSTNRADAIMMASVVEGLIRYNREATGIEPALADSWKISDNFLEYTFHLRPGIKFSDGSAITPADFVFSIKQVGKVGVWNWLVENVSTVEAVDAEQIKITLKTVQPDFLISLAMIQLAVYPEASLGAADDSKAWFKHPITAGPFYIKEFVAQDHIVLAKNPSYWELGKDGKSLPYLDEVRINQVPEDTTRVLQVRSGGLDGTVDVPYSQVKELQADKSGDIKFQTFPALQTNYVFINHTKPPFDDVKVRRALAMAMDRNALVESVTAGIGTPAYTFMPKGGMCFDPDIKIDYDLAKAKQLISESKYPNGYTGGIIYVPAGNVIGSDLATFTQAMWAEVGINVKVQQIDIALLATKFNKNKRGVAGEYDVIAGYQWTNQMLDPSQQTAWMSTQPAINSGYDNQAMWDLVDQAKKETDPVKRCKLYSDIQKLWNVDAVAIPLFYSVSRVITGKVVMNYYTSPFAWHDFKHTWLSR